MTATKTLPEATKARKTRTKAAPVTTDKVKLYATLVMGIAIPLLSLGLSNTGGTLTRADHNVLAGFAFFLMACVLAVSLSHLAWSIEDITRSPRWASWLLAITFDLMLVLAELCHVSAADAGVGTVTTVMMVAVAGLSMFLNCWAFIKHPAK
jgi:hypothetical protein